MKQRLGDDSSIEVWMGEDATGVTFGGVDPQGYALILHDHALDETVALSEEEFILLKMTLLSQSAELKRELLRFVQFIESMGVLPAQQASIHSDLRGKLIQHYQSFTQLVDLFMETDNVDWAALAEDDQ